MLDTNADLCLKVGDQESGGWGRNRGGVGNRERCSCQGVRQSNLGKASLRVMLICHICHLGFWIIGEEPCLMI